MNFDVKLIIIVLVSCLAAIFIYDTIQQKLRERETNPKAGRGNVSETKGTESSNDVGEEDDEEDANSSETEIV